MCPPLSSLPTVAPLGTTWMGAAADREGPSSRIPSPWGFPLDSGDPCGRRGGTAGALQAAGRPGGPEGQEGPGRPGAPTSRATSLRGGAGQATLLWGLLVSVGSRGELGVQLTAPPPGGNAGKYPLCLRSWAERPHWPRPLVAGHGDRRLSALSSAAQRPGASHTARPATLKCPRAGGALPAARQPCDLPRGWGAALRAW